MRFLLLSQYYAPEIGAPQVRLRALIRVVRKLGHEVEVVTALPNYPTGEIFPEYRRHFYLQETIDGVKVHRVWIYAAMGTGAKRIVNYLSFICLTLLAFCRCRRPDFLLVESPPPFLSLPGIIAAHLWKSKLIINEADFWIDAIKKLGLVRSKTVLFLVDSLEKWFFKKAYRINAITEGIRNNLLKKGVNKNKILFLPNGVDTEMFKPGPSDEELARNLNLTGKKIILYAGNHGSMHGMDNLLAAAKIIASRPEILMVLIGDGSEKERLQKVATHESLTNVRFLDPAPPEFIARLLSLSFAGLASVRNIPISEGVRSAKMFPVMASGVPVLYCGFGEGARLVQEAQAGLTVPPDNPQALANGILRLAGDQTLAKELGQNGRNYVEKHLRWTSLVTNWLEELS